MFRLFAGRSIEHPVTAADAGLVPLALAEDCGHFHWPAERRKSTPLDLLSDDIVHSGCFLFLFCFTIFFSEPATDGRNDLRTFDGGTGRWPVAGAALDVQGMLPGGGPARLRFGANVRRWEESFVSTSFSSSSSSSLHCASGKLCVSPLPAVLGYGYAG